MIDYKTILKAADWIFIGGCNCNGTRKDEFKKEGVLLLVYPSQNTFRLGNKSYKLDELQNHI